MPACLKCGSALDAQRDFVAGDWRCPQCGHWSAATTGEAIVAAEPASHRGHTPPNAPPGYGPAPPKPPVVVTQMNPFADVTANPYATPYFPPYLPDRNRALSKVQGPGILMQIYGGLLVLTGIGLGIAFPFVMTTADMNDEDQVILLVMCGGGAPLSLVIGALTVWGGTRMKSLRSYGIAMTAVVISFVLAILVCIPAALVSVWPLIVLLDSEVKACFDRP